MPERTDLTAAPGAIRDAARAAASAEALTKRVAELEAQLATERSHNAGRVREIDAAMRVLRRSMQELQAEIQRGAAERERLQEQLDQSRRNLAAITTATGPAEDRGPDEELVLRIEHLESELSDARADADAARLERDDLRGIAEELRNEVGRREATVAEVRERLSAAECRVAELSRSLRSAVATPGRGARADDASSQSRGSAQETEHDDLIFDTCDPPSIEAPRAAPAKAAPSAAPSHSVVYGDAGSADESVSVGIGECESIPQAEAAAPPPAHGPELLDDSRTGPVPASHARLAPAAAVPSPAAAAAPLPQTDRRAPPEISQDPAFPEIPGHRIERLLDASALGSVYEAREVATRRPVLVRVLPGVLKLLDGKRLDSLLLAKHPNLVSVLSFAVSRAGPYLVMERAEGEPADHWIRRVGPLPERIALAVALECARGLRQAAFHGALHLDLAPDAILVDAAGKVRVGGVGLRPVLSPNDHTARCPAFAAPERLRDGAPVDVRTDIYSLGAVIFHLITGRAPFSGTREEIARLQAVGAPDVRETRPEVSAETAKLVQRMLSPDADLRHATWDQVLVDIERRLPGQNSPELRGNLRARIRRFAVVHPWVVPAAITTLLAVAVITRIALAPDETAADRFRIAKVRVQAAAAKGDPETARDILRPFLRNAGDPAIEREAARLFDELRSAPK